MYAKTMKNEHVGTYSSQLPPDTQGGSNCKAKFKCKHHANSLYFLLHVSMRNAAIEFNWKFDVKMDLFVYSRLGDLKHILGFYFISDPARFYLF